jgi:hypothetical protein
LQKSYGRLILWGGFLLSRPRTDPPMLDQRQLANLLVFDVETVHGQAEYEQLDPILQKHWARRARRMAQFDPSQLADADDPADPHFGALYREQAAIHAEFGRIVCITVGSLVQSGQGWRLYHRSYAGPDEAEILRAFSQVLDNHIDRLPQPENNAKALCGHNIKNFDIPYLCRRLLINEVPMPVACRVWNLKPWEMRHLVDTMELWRFGEYRSFAPLELLTQVMGIPSPKADMDGSRVSDAFWHEGDHAKIAQYCEQDVIATAQLALKLAGEPLLAEADIISKTAQAAAGE